MIYFANNSSAQTKVGDDRIKQQEFSLIKFVNVAVTDYTKLYQNVNIILDVNDLNHLTYIYYLYFSKKPSIHHHRQTRPIAAILELI